MEENDIFIVTAGIDRAFSDKITALAQMMYSNNPTPLDSFTELSHDLAVFWGLFRCLRGETDGHSCGCIGYRFYSFTNHYRIG